MPPLIVRPEKMSRRIVITSLTNAPAREAAAPLALQVVADILDRLADLAAGAAESFLNITRGLVCHPFVVDALVVGQIAPRLLHLALDLLSLAVELVLILHALPSIGT